MKRKGNFFIFPTVMAVLGVIFSGATTEGQSPLLPVIERIQRALGIENAPQPKDNPGQPAEDLAANVFPNPDRATLQLLSQAKVLLQKGRYSEAVRDLGAILDSQEDYFFQPTTDRAIHRSLKAEAQRIVGEMPKEGRDLYEARFGDRARQMLNTAVASGDVAAIAEVARRFFHTKAGYEATFLLGLHHLDHARPLAAALTLQRLKEVTYLNPQFEPILSLALATSWLQAGSREKAKEVLIDFKNHNPNRQLVIGGKKVSFFNNDAEALNWLAARVGTLTPAGKIEADRWVMFRGDPQRNAASQGSAPLLNMRWEVPAAADPAVEESLQVIYRWKTDSEQPLLPSSHPLVLDDVVLMRTFRNLVAIDFGSGKRIWEVPVDESSENNTNINGDVDVPFRPRFGGMNAAGMPGVRAVERSWDDSLFGTLSSDGRFVYSIEDAWPNGSGSARIAGFQPSVPGTSTVFNYLAARDIGTGKLKWTLGGPNDRFGLPLAETFFLGPPLPLLGQLYIIGEVKNEIRLFVIDPDPQKKRDRVVWSQQLAVVEHGIQEDPTRRMTGISPSYADGILVCPTSVGALVAVDLATRSLLWGYRYGREGHENYPMMLRGPFGGSSYAVEGARWADSSICIIGGRVLVSPVDSDILHCLTLADGGLKWKVPRQDGLYVACVDKDNVVVVGKKQVRAYRLTDGKPAWEGGAVALPDDSLPSGRGFLGDGKYYLPLSSAQVAAIDLNAGKIERFSKSQKGEIPGNLVCYKGRILSQNYRGLEAFYQLHAAEAEVASRLAANPRDAAAFCLRGEILLDSGNRAAAVESYRTAFEIAPEPRSKLLLRDTMLDGLRLEFATYRTRGAEIEKLLENSPQRAAYLRLMIAGLQNAGEMKSAFDECQSLMNLDPGRIPLEPVSKTQSVRRDRWIRARLEALRREAKPELASYIDDTIAARLKDAQAEGSIDALRSFLAYFDNQPPAVQAHGELIEKLKKSGRPLDVELALWQTQRAPTLGIGGPALAAAAEFYRQSGSTEPAIASYRWLSSRFGDTVCLGGKTGRQLVEALPPQDPLRTAIAHRDEWPTGRVEPVSESTRKYDNRNSYGRIPLEFRGNHGPYFEGMNMVYDSNRIAIVCFDPQGNEAWQLPLNDDNRAQNQFLSASRDGAQIRAWGHVMFIPVSGRLAAVDTLGADRTHPPKFLWTEETGDARPDIQGGAQVVLGNGGAMFLGAQQNMMYGANQSGEANFVTNRYLCIQRSRTLRAMNPLDGQTLWERQDVPLASTIFGDDEYVFVLPADKPAASVYRALDGELLGTRKIERHEVKEQAGDGTLVTTFAPLTMDCLAAFGRNLLMWRQNGDRRTLELFDVWQQKSLWPARTFSAKAQYDMLNRELLAILEPSGKLALVSLPDGRLLAESQLEAENNLGEVIIIPYEDTYLVLTNSYPRFAVNPLQMNAVTGGSDKAIMRGRLYAIDRQGKLLWPQPVKIVNQHLVASQGQGFPVLVFATQIYEPQSNDKPAKFRTAVQMIDKRTGRIAYDNQDLPQTTFFNVTADPEKKAMQIALQRIVITLTFTDRPWPTKEEIERQRAEAKKNAPRKSIFKAMKNAAQNALKMPQIEEGFEELQLEAQ